MIKQNIKPKAVGGIVALAVVIPAALLPLELLVEILLALLPENINRGRPSAQRAVKCHFYRSRNGTFPTGNR